MRIVAGKFRGRQIAAPKGRGTRPTTDRVRENLFNVLENRISFSGIRVLDLFAGSGALGLEALSRGATHCVFVENASAARGAILSNLETLGLMASGQIFRRDAARLGPVGTMPPFDLVFADPPYGRKLGDASAQSLVDGSWLNPGAVVSIEESKGTQIAAPEELILIDRRLYGVSEISLFEYQPGSHIS